MLSLAHALQINEVNVQVKVISLEEGEKLLVFPDVPGLFRSFGYLEKCGSIAQFLAVKANNINAKQMKF